MNFHGCIRVDIIRMVKIRLFCGTVPSPFFYFIPRALVCTEGSGGCCCHFPLQKGSWKLACCISRATPGPVISVYLYIRSHWTSANALQYVLSLPPPIIVTERANHARDHLKTEAQLDKYDGWVLKLFLLLCHAVNPGSKPETVSICNRELKHFISLLTRVLMSSTSLQFPDMTFFPWKLRLFTYLFTTGRDSITIPLQ